MSDGPSAVDFVVVGGGPAGMSAALVASLNGLDTWLLEGTDRLGGQVRWADAPVPDLLGAYAASGDALADRFATHIESSKARIRRGVAVRSIRSAGDGVRLTLATGEQTTAHRVLLATGLRHRRLAVPGIELADRIASPRKAPESWRDRRVAVVGGGDEASSLAYDLATHGATVSLLVRSVLRARPAFAEPVRREPRVAIRQGAVTERFEGGAGGDAGGGEITVVLTSGERLAVDECFVRIGVEPSLPQIEPALERRADGRLRVDGQMRTSCDTLFAAGDLVRPPAERYIAAALADGAIVARNVEGDLAGTSSG